MSTGIEVGGWFASACVAKLLDAICSFIIDQYKYRANIMHNLKCLEKDLKKIQAVLHEADKRKIQNPALQEWLWDLKDACYEAEDILDIFVYKSLKDKVEKKQNKVSLRLQKHLRNFAKRSSFLDDEGKELNYVVDKFRRITKDMGYLMQLISSEPTISENIHEIMQSRETSSLCIDSQLIGRYRERSYLREQLSDRNCNDGASSSKNVHVLPVVGIGGVGKTTLVQNVYSDQNVKCHFDLTAWVCVSDDFDVKRLVKEIIDSARISKPHDFHSLKSLDSIQEILKSGLTGKKFLIVLDDVWNEVAEEWEMLQAILNYGEKGSRVVVTTRSNKIADMMGTRTSIHLGGLREDDYWRFFKGCAFCDRDPKSYPSLELIGRQIVKRLAGNPLAAKTVGAVLRYDLNLKHWREVLESNLWKVDQQKRGIMAVLRLSYDYLPKHLKQCFIYCSLFPQDYPFEVSELVRLWIAHGFIQSDVEEVGVEYFDELFSRSFFQKAKAIYRGDRYVIHDLLHDLAKELCGGEICDCAENKSIEDPKRVRHVYVSANNLSQLCNNEYVKKNLRSLVVTGCSNNPLQMLKELRGLRVLILDDFGGELLSESIFNKMVHLRYLRLRPQTTTFKLPKSIGVLYHIQVIRLREGKYLSTKIGVPEEINRLVNLRHLDADTRGVAGIGTLTLLKEINYLVKQREDGFEMRQLGGMSELRQLKIRGLKSVGSKQEACGAMLEKKQRLKKLSLFWDDVGGHSLDLVINNNEQVLEGLRPHHNLEELTIRNYLGRRSPSWWDRSGAASCYYLQKIEMRECPNWEVLPPFGQLPHLKHLKLMGMKGVKRMGTEVCVSGNNNNNSMIVFPAMEILSLWNMPELMELWKTEEDGGHGNAKIEWFPRLSYMCIDGCPKLRGPLFLPSHLKVLCVEINKWRPFIKLGNREGLSVRVPDVSRLIGWVPLQNLSSIVELTFKAMELRRFPPELGEWFPHLTSLRSLYFKCCHELESLPEEGLPTSLNKLNLYCCSDELAKGCSKEENGREWHQISHIPTIRINCSSSRGGCTAAKQSLEVKPNKGGGAHAHKSYRMLSGVHLVEPEDHIGAMKTTEIQI